MVSVFVAGVHLLDILHPRGLLGAGLVEPGNRFLEWGLVFATPHHLDLPLGLQFVEPLPQLHLRR